MSGQRYLPNNDQRYPRDRSPPRHPERFPSPVSYSSRSNTFDQRQDVPTGPGANREAPKGPKALVEPPRGSDGGPTPAFAPRGGRGSFPRGAFRGEFRDREVRDSPRSPLWTGDRDRAWREREFDRRDRRPSPPRARPSQNDVRDFRDQPPNDADAGRPFRGARDGPGPSPANAQFPDARDGPPPFDRGGYARGRGRGDWDPRGRGRGPHLDERPRSPPRDTYRARDPPRDERGLEWRDDRQPERRDVDKATDREDRERDPDRFRRESYPLNSDLRRTSAPSTESSTPVSQQFSAQTQQSNPERLVPEPGRDAFAARRLSGAVPAPPIKDFRRRSFQNDSALPRIESSRDLQTKRASSPPQAPQVPAFGSVPAAKTSPTEPQPWNVWRASSDGKTPQSAPNSSTATPKAPPTAPRSDLERLPPKGPKADRLDLPDNRDQLPSKASPEAMAQGRGRTPPPAQYTLKQSPQLEAGELTPDRMRTSPRPPTSRQFSLNQGLPTGPSSLNQASYRSQPPLSVPGGPASGFAAPTGPRGGPPPTSPRAAPAFIPTGPKADRSQYPTSRSASGPQPTGQWGWSRVGPQPNAARGSSLVPTKRDYGGEAKGQTSPRSPSDVQMGNYPSQNNQQFQEPEEKRQQPKQEFETPKTKGRFGAMDSPTAAQNIDHFAEEEDPMDLDEGDFAGHEEKFQREMAALEARKIDLSSRHLRSTTPLEQLARLACITGIEPRSRHDVVAEAENIDPKQAQSELLTPSAEDREDSVMVDVPPPPPPRPRQPSTPPISTPEILALPFLNQGPPTPFSELEVLNDNRERNETSKEHMLAEISRRLEYRLKSQNALREEYSRLYKPWKRYVNELDRQREEEERKRLPSSEPNPQVAAPETAPAALLPTPNEGRRSHKFASEYEIEKAMEESAKMFQEAQAKQAREALHAKPDLNREAIVPDMLEEFDRTIRIVKDTSRLRDPSVAFQVFELVPPPDDFTPDEHETLVQNFREFPKKWGKLAQALPGRTYKECINHYYATKWSGEYKPPKDKRRKGGPRKTGRASGKPRANALMSNLEIRPDVYQGDEFGQPVIAMTDSGRPRRAAAPTFGERDTDGDTAQSSTPARKNGGNKGDSASEANTDKSVKRPRVPRDKSSRRAKNQSISATLGGSPAKQDPEQRLQADDDMRAREMDVTNGLAHMQTGQGMAWPSNGISYQETSGDGSDESMARGHANQNSRAGPLSYWSVREVNRFPAYLAHFGTDWPRLAAHMGTKSAKMVQNYYVRSLTQGRKDMEELANKANTRIERGEDMGTPPSPTMSMRARRPDLVQPVAPRQLAPNTEVVEINDDAMPSLQPQVRTSVPMQAQIPYSNYPPPSQHTNLQRMPGAAQQPISTSSSSYVNGTRDPQPIREPHVEARIYGQDPGYPPRQVQLQQAQQGHQYYPPRESQTRHPGERPQDHQWPVSARPELGQSQGNAAYGPPPQGPAQAQQQQRGYEGIARSPTRYEFPRDGHQDVRPQYVRAGDQPQTQQSNQYWLNRQNSGPQQSSSPYNATSSRRSPPPQEDLRSSYPAHPAPVQAPPPKAQPEQRKSNILDLLNSEPEEPKPKQEFSSQPIHSAPRPHSPPHTMYQGGLSAPNRPSSNPSTVHMYPERRPYDLNVTSQSSQPASTRQPAQEYSKGFALQRTSSSEWPTQSRPQGPGPSGPSLFDQSRERKSIFSDRGQSQQIQYGHNPPSSNVGSYGQPREPSFPPGRSTMPTQQQQQPSTSQPQQVLHPSAYGPAAGLSANRGHPPPAPQAQQGHTHGTAIGAYPEHRGHRPRQNSEHALSRPPGAPETSDYDSRQHQHRELEQRQWQQQQIVRHHLQDDREPPRPLFGEPRASTPPQHHHHQQQQTGRGLFGGPREGRYDGR